MIVPAQVDEAMSSERLPDHEEAPYVIRVAKAKAEIAAARLRSSGILLRVVGIAFLLAPTRVFLAVVDDIILLLAIAVPLVVAVMILAATADLDLRDNVGVEEADRYSQEKLDVGRDLIMTLQPLLIAAGLEFAAKFVCVWFVGRGWLAWPVNHVAAGYAGMMTGFAIGGLSGFALPYNLAIYAREMMFHRRVRGLDH